MGGGHIYLDINNEPLIDKRIEAFSKYIKDKTSAKVVVITNGTLLQESRIDELFKYIDEIIINDYGEKYRLSATHRNIYQYIKKNRKKFDHVKVTINRRYAKEILATRAGYAPNKPKKNNTISNPCVYPFMDIPIFPDGKVGMCCNDCFEKTDFGNVNEQSLLEIWNGKSFQDLRRKLTSGRAGIEECNRCDVVDAGSREQYIKDALSDK